MEEVWPSLDSTVEEYDDEYDLNFNLFSTMDQFSVASDRQEHDFFDEYVTPFDLGVETQNIESEDGDPNNMLFGEEDDEHVNFLTDLLESVRTHMTDDRIRKIDSDRPVESNISLPVIGLDSGSDSDSEEFDINLGFTTNCNIGDIDHEFRIDRTFHISENDREVEELGEGIHFDETEIPHYSIDATEELIVSSESDRQNSIFFDDQEEYRRNLEWQVLLEASSFNRYFVGETFEEIHDDENEIPNFHLHDHIWATDNSSVFSEIVENTDSFTSFPPASKALMKNLPSVVLTKDVLEHNNNKFICAVCLESVEIGMNLTSLPCHHMFHRECILPWLSIRNTCPVCRYEFPTDDPDNGNYGFGLNFELLL